VLWNGLYVTKVFLGYLLKAPKQLVNLPFILRTEVSCSSGPVSVSIAGNGSAILFQDTTQIFADLTPATSKILGVLLNEPQVSLQLYVASSFSFLEASKAECEHRVGARQRLLGLFAVLYGAADLFEAVGEFASKCRLFLQHPRFCDRDVEYCNPHCILQESRKVLSTRQLGFLDPPDEGSSVQLEAFSNPIDLFTRDDNEHNLPQARAPESLVTELYKHQKQALTFMSRREQGWLLTEDGHDVWRKISPPDGGKATYLNVITGQKQTRPPPEFRGGLLTDAPGLGKTLSIIALIAGAKEERLACPNTGFSARTTLLVVPKTLIQTWKDELERHVRPGTLSYRVYYGKDKHRHLQELHSADLIITTYSIVRLDWKASMKQDNQATLHRVSWDRIVLDEAHIIREPNKSLAKSVCALKAKCRWVVTGTPIQNRLRDLFSLFKYLQCYPFDDLIEFNLHITQQWKARSDPNSIAKLKLLVNSLSLRRPKETVYLPFRRDRRIPLQFCPKERQYYEFIRTQTRQRLSLAAEELGCITFINALKWVNELRLICNHGIRNCNAAWEVVAQDGMALVWTEQLAQNLFDSLDQVNLATCSSPDCCQDLSSEPLTDDANITDECWAGASMRLLCLSCIQGRSREDEVFFPVCNHIPRCSRTTSFSQNPVAQVPQLSQFQCFAQLPTKVQALVEDLCQVTSQTKRLFKSSSLLSRNLLTRYSVIFSGWTKSFDIIQPALTQRGIRCVRLDGSLSAARRAGVLRVFRATPDIKVLLATITCGGVGLDLTVASRAYILEPQWNPMSESQALDRIHRLGQKSEVETIRYIMKDSWEEVGRY
jgi:SWI/SNF-related matrix-associated actin-dependent regulator of chromatin subfamily A3